MDGPKLVPVASTAMPARKNLSGGFSRRLNCAGFQRGYEQRGGPKKSQRFVHPQRNPSIGLTVTTQTTKHVVGLTWHHQVSRVLLLTNQEKSMCSGKTSAVTLKDWWKRMTWHRKYNHAIGSTKPVVFTPRPMKRSGFVCTNGS